VEGQAKFLGKLIGVSVGLIDRFTILLNQVDQMCLLPEHMQSLDLAIEIIILFHLAVDCVGPLTITRI